MTRTLLAVCCCLTLITLLALPETAGADSAIAFQGEAAPGSGGGSFDFLAPPTTNDLGHVAFRALMSGGTASQGVHLDKGAGLIPVAVSSGAAPDTGGATFSTFGDAAINGSGAVAFTATVSGGTATRGLFLYSSTGVLSALATTQTTAPGTGGGFYTAFGTRISINDSGGNVGSGTTTGGIFVEDGSSGRDVFLAGAPAPAGVVGTYFNFTNPAINASGDVAVTVSIFLSPSGFVSAVVVESAMTDSFAALVGDAAPTSRGTYSAFNFSGAPAINASGDVFFWSNVSGGSASNGIFVDSAGVDSAVVLQGDAAPDTGGADFFSFSSTGFSVNDAGDVGYSAVLLGGSVAQGLFTSAAGQAAEAVALLGEQAPDAGAATYFILGDAPSIDSSTGAAFRANLTGGTAASAIVLVPEPGGAASWMAACGLLLLLSRTRRS